MRYVNADITTAPEMFILHGCNMQGKMNSGVAKALRVKYPQIYEDYTAALKTGECRLGDFIVSYVDRKCIINLLTQDRYGYDGKEYASAQAIYDSVKAYLFSLHIFYELNLRLEIAIPKIGCGRGGLDWNSIELVFRTFEDVYGVEFVVYDVKDEYSK